MKALVAVGRGAAPLELTPRPRGTAKAAAGGGAAVGGGVIVSGAFDRLVKVWSIGSWECVATLKGHKSGITALTACSTEVWVASASNDNTIRVWERHGWACVVVIEAHTDTVWALADYEGQLLSGSSDCTIKVWNKETWKCDATLMGHVQAVHAILPLPTTGEGGSFISASWDHSIAVWQ